MSEVVKIAVDANSTEAVSKVKNTDDAGVAGNNERPNSIVSLFSAMVMGFIFGFLFEKSHVYEPASIRGQFIFKKWIMMKMFLGAVTGSCVVFAALSVVAPKVFAQVRAAFPPTTRGFVSGGIAGGVLLGFGMCLAGACPGMVLPQVGTLLPNALVTMAGGVTGALTFGLAEPYLQPMFLSKGAQCNQEEKYFLDVRLQKPFSVMCSALGVMCAAVTIVLEVVVPFADEIHTGHANANVMAQKAWPPSLCGFFIGCLQLPCGLACKDSLGSATGYQVISAQWLHVIPQSKRLKFEYLDKFRSGACVWWQVFYIGVAVLGAAVSAVLSDSMPTSAAGVDVASAFVGGFLMIFGSRLGGGCTSGHGISGMPLLHSLSIVGVCAMFGAAIVLGFIMDFTNTIELKGLEGWF